jgi:hypothetical protein
MKNHAVVYEKYCYKVTNLENCDELELVSKLSY